MSETQPASDGHRRTRAAGLPPQNGTAIRCFREKDGYSQNKFAQHLRMDQANLSRIEAEVVHATMPTLMRIARALGIQVAAILRGTEAADSSESSAA